ncbi:MAG: ligase-associated DNA damage response endonuclease PdeM [Minwuia sp.]|uniref:ligase-associated DNA damage response endonuclease PdeM n=1 Tax=Minwuia sp. TaxID=2493630 RepID=UPI003A873C56
MLVNGARLVADPSGALFWPAERLLVVSDLHFEKGSAMAARGHGLLPPYDTIETLTRIERLLKRFTPARLICLGDSFHDMAAYARMSGEERQRLAAISLAQDTIWIAGNHDPEPPAEIGGTVAGEVAMGPLVFRHEPTPNRIAPGEVAGHLHPKARIRRRGRSVSARCFATDGSRVIVPAFGAYTGGLDVTDPAFRGLFRGGYHAWMMLPEKVYAVPAARLARRDPPPSDGRVVSDEGEIRQPADIPRAQRIGQHEGQ